MTEKEAPQNSNDQNSNDVEQEPREQRRKVLKSTLAGGAVITASVVPDKWTRPAVDSVMLPAHAATTGDGGDPGTGTTAAPVTTLPPTGEEPLPGPWFGVDVPSYFRALGVQRTDPEESGIASELFARAGEVVVGSSHAGPVPTAAAMLCISMKNASEVNVTYAAHWGRGYVPFPGDHETLGIAGEFIEVAPIPTEGYVVWEGSGPLGGGGFHIDNTGCSEPPILITVSNPTESSIAWFMFGQGGTIPADGCDMPDPFCPPSVVVNVIRI